MAGQIIASFSDDAYALYPEGHRVMGDVVEAFHDLQNRWGELKINVIDSYVSRLGALWWFSCPGQFDKRRESKEMWNYQVEQLQEVLDSSLSQKEKIFLIQRDIASCFREVASGCDYSYPCRFEAALFMDKGVWKLANMHLSFPYNWIVKGRFL